jgi:teichuronic acid biosynthesis glycosyltransferase TuaC
MISVLTVCRELPDNYQLYGKPVAAFIFEQNESIEKLGVEYEYYLIKKGGLKGYIFHVKDFAKFLRDNGYKYDIIHAHSGHMGILANFQRSIPVVTTFHGSDINNLLTRLLSIFSLILSKKNIFVSKRLLGKSIVKRKAVVIPCGVDFDIFKPMDKNDCRKELGFPLNRKLVLFGGRFDIKVKNASLAKRSLENLPNYDLIELKGYKRDEVAKLINACDCMLLTSITEGSPMVIKEALACNCPIVSVDVGDVKELSKGIDGVFISRYNSEEISENIVLAVEYNNIDSRSKIEFLDKQKTATQIYNIYVDAIKGLN